MGVHVDVDCLNSNTHYKFHMSFTCVGEHVCVIRFALMAECSLQSSQFMIILQCGCSYVSLDSQSMSMMKHTLFI